MILMHFINQTLTSCCIRSSAPAGRTAWAGGTRDTRDDEPSKGSGTALGCPALCHPLILAGSAPQLWLAQGQWQRVTGQGDKVAPHEPGSPSEKGSPTAPGTGSGLHRSARSPVLGSSKLSEL